MSSQGPIKNLLKFLTGKAPKLVGAIAEGGLNIATGGVSGKIKDLITGSTELSKEDKELALLELQYDYQQYIAELQDRQDARSMYEDTTKSEDKFIRRFPAYLSIGFMLILFAFALALVFVEIPESNKSVIFSIVGSMVAVVTSIGGFYFGSSSASKDKTNQLSQVIQALRK